MELKNKTIVVTGGGNGMGRELVLNLLNKGCNVIALDINEAALQQTARMAGDRKEALAVFAVDISRHDSVEAVVNGAVAAFGHIDGIINNAGIIQPFEKLGDTDFTVIKRVFDINFFGTLYVIKAFLPHLQTRPEAHIVNVSSMGGFLPVPGQATYGASKAAVKILSESLTSELTGTGVRVTTVVPGAIFTNIKANSGLGAGTGVNAADCKTAPKGALHPSLAAGMIVRGMEENKTRIFLGRDSRTMNLLYRLNPALACRLIYGKMRSKINAA